MTDTNESKQTEASWVFSFINVVIIVSCFIIYTFSYFIRTYFILNVYFIPSAISSFVKIMVNVCNPQNCIKFKFVFMFLWDSIFSILWPWTNSKPNNCKKCYSLFTSPLSYCIAHSFKCTQIFWNFITVAIIHSMSVKLSVDLGLLIWFAELL